MGSVLDDLMWILKLLIPQEAADVPDITRVTGIEIYQNFQRAT